MGKSKQCENQAMQTLQMHTRGNSCTCAHWLQTPRYPVEEGCQISQQALPRWHISLKKQTHTKTPLLFSQVKVKINTTANK